eukprot:scaffold919_cov152-Skeletonema_marinoi.AAC.3
MEFYLLPFSNSLVEAMKQQDENTFNYFLEWINHDVSMTSIFFACNQLRKPCTHKIPSCASNNSYY